MPFFTHCSQSLLEEKSQAYNTHGKTFYWHPKRPNEGCQSQKCRFHMRVCV